MNTEMREPSQCGEDVNAAHEAAVREALARIAPLFPSRSFVAVNPFLGFTNLPFEEAAWRVMTLRGRAPLLDANEYRKLFAKGEITIEDLDWVTDASWSVAQLLTALESPVDHAIDVPWTAVDALESERAEERWRDFVVEEISKWCAVYYDQNQTTWTLPWARAGLYSVFREAARFDRAPDTHGLHTLRDLVATLPPDAEAAIAVILRELAPPSGREADFVYGQLALVSGWAGYCQYLVHEHRLKGDDSPALRELLAFRLAYDLALLRMRPNLRSSFGVRRRSVTTAPLAALCRWQLAYEVAWQRAVLRKLTQAHDPLSPTEPKRPRAQAVFCIDVRSEPLRRHLEGVSEDVRTLGFAGFFGFPLSHERPDGSGAEARCPALLAPTAESAECGVRRHDRAVRARARASTSKAIQNAAASCFSFVEAAGLAFLAQLWSQTDTSGPAWLGTPKPALLDFEHSDLDALAVRAEATLRNMSLTRNFGRLLLLCGHGSHSANNPFASGLDCGACGGHAGDVNARIAAQVLNHPGVRQRLAGRGIELPEDTWVLAGLHNTMTDEVTLFDLDLTPESHRADVDALLRSLELAGAATRRERAVKLGHATDEDLLYALRKRAQDIAQTRPEWGLAGNAAIIVAPRQRTCGLDFEGRTFLHEYRHEDDQDGRMLQLILSAPVVVASWINLQYYGSRVDPVLYGAGNKVLHNVVGGVGVFEGNGGDLRVGLPLQSIHDGERFIHEPRRLSVFVEAPREKVWRAMASLPDVRKLFDGRWIHLLTIEHGEVYAYEPSGFRKLESTGTRQSVAA
ncbi:MAG TPA: DUF2309 domain-containing protein [Polyangiaceae bacterium]|nr:DUF2309 domain-containing protein [Polyangiaceae bacterium]